MFPFCFAFSVTSSICCCFSATSIGFSHSASPLSHCGCHCCPWTLAIATVQWRVAFDADDCITVFKCATNVLLLLAYFMAYFIKHFTHTHIHTHPFTHIRVYVKNFNFFKNFVHHTSHMCVWVYRVKSFIHL